MALPFSTRLIKVSEPHPHVYHVELNRSVSRRSPTDLNSRSWQSTNECVLYRVSGGRPHCRGIGSDQVDRFWKEYGQVFQQLSAEDLDVRAVVLSSALPNVFTAGIDCMFFIPYIYVC